MKRQPGIPTRGDARPQIGQRGGTSEDVIERFLAAVDLNCNEDDVVWDKVRRAWVRSAG
jgi:hypothetical protein